MDSIGFQDIFHSFLDSQIRSRKPLPDLPKSRQLIEIKGLGSRANPSRCKLHGNFLGLPTVFRTGGSAPNLISKRGRSVLAVACVVFHIRSSCIRLGLYMIRRHLHKYV